MHGRHGDEAGIMWRTEPVWKLRKLHNARGNDRKERDSFVGLDAERMVWVGWNRGRENEAREDQERATYHP